MTPNAFIPAELQIMPDSKLIRTYVEYEHVRRLMQSSFSPLLHHLTEPVTDALQAIEKELCARGLEDYCPRVEGVPQHAEHA